MKLPDGVTVGAIVRGETGRSWLTRRKSVQQDDHLILFLTDKKHVAQVEKPVRKSA